MTRWPWRRDRERRRMDCARVARTLQAYLDGESDELTGAQIAIHLEHCRRCGLEAAAYQAIKDALARRMRPDPAAVDRLRDYGQALLSGPEPGERP